MLYKPTLAQIARFGHVNHPRYRGCVGHWLLNDGGGLVAFDVSGFRNDGTLTNMDPGTDWVGGPHGWALDFDGADDVVAVTQRPSINDLDTLTIAVWVYPRTLGESGLGRIVDKQNANADGEGFLSMASPASLVFGAARWATTNGNWTAPNNTVPLNTWTHVVVTYGYTATTEDPLIYTNGVSQTVTETQTPAGSKTTGETETLNLGNRNDGLRAFNGLIDDIRLYNRVLDPDEIASLFTDPFLEFRTRRRRIFKAAAAAGDATISATESGRVAATEAQAPTATLAPAESAPVAETDLTGVSATLAPADVVAIVESDAAFPTPAVAAAESAAVVEVEATALSPALAPSDAAAVVESDASEITATLGPTDASALGAVEAIGALSAALSASDADVAGLSEQAPIDAAISAADFGRVGITETASVVESEPGEIAEAPAAIPEVFTAGWVRVPPVPAPGYGRRRRGRVAVHGPIPLVLAVGRTHAPRRGLASLIGLQGHLDGRARLIRLMRTGYAASGVGAGMLRAVGVTVSPDLIAQRAREEIEFLTPLVNKAVQDALLEVL